MITYVALSIYQWHYGEHIYSGLLPSYEKINLLMLFFHNGFSFKTYLLSIKKIL